MPHHGRITNDHRSANSRDHVIQQGFHGDLRADTGGITHRYGK
jgi:hypothetical protein